ncbi:MAG: hypothetical protein ACKPKO_31295, partial [Candidatus Fonsibacter sp.]
MAACALSLLWLFALVELESGARTGSPPGLDWPLSCPFTYTAGIVIAVHPYRWFPDLSTDVLRQRYLVFDGSKLPPHAYAASDVGRITH